MNRYKGHVIWRGMMFKQHSVRMIEIKKHLYTHWEQHKTYNQLKNELEPNEMMVHVATYLKITKINSNQR